MNCSKTTRRSPLALAALAPLAVITVLGLSLAFATPAFACTCVENPPPEEALQQADYVFTGTVKSIKSTSGGRSGFPTLTVTFDVASVYKGNVNRNFVVQTAENSAACGYEFQEGTSYIVYAYAPEGSGNPSTGLCSRTAPLDQASEDIEALGEPMKTY